MRKKIKDIQENTPFVLSEITQDNFVDTLDYSGHTIGDIVCYSPLYDRLIEKFGSYDDAKNVYGLCRELISNGGYLDLFNTNGGSVPYLDLNFYLEETITDNGLLTPLISRWIPGKRYYVGDFVYYSSDGTDENMIPYILRHGDSKDVIEISYETYLSYDSGDEKVYESGGKYYLIVDVYNGNYDEDYNVVYFDDIDDNRELIFNHWESCLVTGNVLPPESTGNTYENGSESLLLNLKRRKASMDDNSNVLPFVPHYEITGEGRFKTRELITDKTEAMYRLGAVNIVVNSNGVVTCDYLKRVSFTDDYNKIPRIDYAQTDSVIICDNTTYSGYTKIIFEYYIGVELDSSGNTVDNTGVKYIEERNFTVEKMTTTIDNTECEDIPYFNISDDYVFSESDNADLFNSGRGVIYANLTLDPSQIGKTAFANIATYKDERINGVQDVIQENDARFDRGIATSFERHNALGEINTMQDLEHYRNDFFKISKQ